LCSRTNLTTWASFTGTNGDGRKQVEIKSGYVLPDPAFAEDANAAYSADLGNISQGGCDQLAVIVRESESAYFGGVAGADGYQPTTRSVGRVTIGNVETEAVALLLLEPTDCGALVTEGNSSFVRVRATPIGAPTRPGLIQVNSSATTNCTGSARAIEGSSLLAAYGGGPSIVAEDATTAGKKGRIGAHALVTNAAFAHTAACDAVTAGCTIMPVPADRGTVSREPVDIRYRNNMVALKTRATTATGLSDSAAASAGYQVYPNTSACNALSNTTVTPANNNGKTKVFLRCNLSVNPGTAITFDDSITDVVIAGSLSVSGTLNIRNARRFYVSSAVSVSGSLVLNDRGFATCALRQAADRSQVTEFVVRTGAFDGGSNAIVRMCSTTVLMADGNLPTTNGTLPSNNAYGGRFSTGAQSTIDWSAPNQSDSHLDIDDPLFGAFEDLALWTETSAHGGVPNRIAGQGNLRTTGVYFLPNANSFVLSGGGSSGAAINSDAQFITRKLRLSGVMSLTMAPNPNNAIPTPVFEQFVLVR
jgi:hypothetical protein